jgi:hypothetical protein
MNEARRVLRNQAIRAMKKFIAIAGRRSSGVSASEQERFRGRIS